VYPPLGFAFHYVSREELGLIKTLKKTELLAICVLISFRLVYLVFMCINRPTSIATTALSNRGSGVNPGIPQRARRQRHCFRSALLRNF